jgi:hypothetical protein
MNNTPKAARRIVVRLDTGADVKRPGSKGKRKWWEQCLAFIRQQQGPRHTKRQSPSSSKPARRLKAGFCPPQGRIKLLDFSLSSIRWRRGLRRGGVFLLVSPLLGPLPTRSSRGEDGEHDAALCPPCSRVLPVDGNPSLLQESSQSGFGKTAKAPREGTRPTGMAKITKPCRPGPLIGRPSKQAIRAGSRRASNSVGGRFQGGKSPR